MAPCVPVYVLSISPTFVGIVYETRRGKGEIAERIRREGGERKEETAERRTGKRLVGAGCPGRVTFPSDPALYAVSEGAVGKWSRNPIIQQTL